MRCFLGVALLGFAATAAPARADFQLMPTLPQAAQASQPAPAPLNPPSPASRVPARRAAGPLAVPLAHGFGRQVPLAFATRQIVPAGVRTTIGPGVDQAALVDWSGGRSWIEALRAAVQPLGLHVTVRWMAIAITAG